MHTIEVILDIIPQNKAISMHFDVDNCSEQHMVHLPTQPWELLLSLPPLVYVKYAE